MTWAFAVLEVSHEGSYAVARADFASFIRTVRALGVQVQVANCCSEERGLATQNRTGQGLSGAGGVGEVQLLLASGRRSPGEVGERLRVRRPGVGCPTPGRTPPRAIHRSIQSHQGDLVGQLPSPASALAVVAAKSIWRRAFESVVTEQVPTRPVRS